MVVPEHDGLQVMVLASICCFFLRFITSVFFNEHFDSAFSKLQRKFSVFIAS